MRYYKQVCMKEPVSVAAVVCGRAVESQQGYELHLKSYNKETQQLQTLPSSMAAYGVLGFDDYSLYRGLTEDEMIQMAIERSLTEDNNTEVQTTASKIQTHRYQAVHQPNQNVPPPANSPSTSKTESPLSTSTTEATRLYSFINTEGQRCTAWRRCNGTTFILPDPEESLDPITKAIRNNNANELLEIFKAGMSMIQANSQGWIPLHEAAYQGKESCLKALLKIDQKMVNRRTLQDETPLFLAVSAEQVACVRCLLDNGADPNIANKDKETPLYKACELDNKDIADMIVVAGGAVNTPCTMGCTALYEAVWHDNLDICKLLLEAGALHSARDKFGITPLFAAAQCCCVKVLRFLIRHGAQVNTQANDGASALFEASKNGHEEAVKLLLSHNGNANIPTMAGFLPLHIAAKRGHDRIVSMLIPVTSKLRVHRSGISPLHLAAERNRDDVLQLLIEAGFDVNATLSLEHSKMYEDRRSTALYFSVCNNNIDAVSMLLEAGANPNLDTFNPLLVAVRQGRIQIITLLIEHGANVNAYVPTHPSTFPATIMFCMKYLSLLKYLLDNGCDAFSCFQCVYGNNPHPPVKGDCRRDNQGERSTPCIQFCEIISTPSICRWAGPIIDVLLDYVGNVQLCSRLIEHLDSYEDWAVIKEKSVSPRPLMHMCRQAIRIYVGQERLKQLQFLPVPRRLIKYLIHEPMV